MFKSNLPLIHKLANSFGKALDEQATHPELETTLIKSVAGVLFVSGTVFVLSSMWVRFRRTRLRSLYALP
jgi:hypothetical protein